MTSRALFRSALLSLFFVLFAGAHPSSADSSHARIIRLSLIQGDVRFAVDVKGDPLASQNVTWERAELNLPIRQGYVLATDKGRAEVEFENGAMAFLGDDTVLEFYDLSLNDGMKNTRLVLRQGTASFYVNAGSGDYFSVTGGDFTVESAERSSFRLDNFNDGSVVNVWKGHVTVLRKNKPTLVAKGQSLSIRAGDDNSVSTGRAPDSDDFDRWVSGRVENEVVATNAAQQYVNSSNYTYGAADLYTYGGWYSVTGCAMCWRPYGVGLGWSPFAGGSWLMDPSFGMTYIGDQPWGWLPYHYGSWLFDPLLGWIWDPVNFGGYGYVPVTGTFVTQKKPGLLGIVPVHPLDAHNKVPLNLAKGVFPVSGGTVGEITPVSAGEEWKTVKPTSVPANTLSPRFVAATAPTPTLRTLASNRGGSSIAYDPATNRFVNANAAPGSALKAPALADHLPATRTTAAVPVQRTATISATRAFTPPPAPRAAESARGGPSGGGFEPSRASSSGFSTPSAPAHASASASSSGGARPH